MTAQSGMGDNLWIDGRDTSGDIGSLSRIACPLAVQDTTPISMSANRRIGLHRDGGIDYTAFWNPGVDADTAHSVHKTLPTTDRALQYCRGTTLGAPAASMIGKQIGYDGSRGNDGSFTLAIQAVANGYGLEWGQQLTPGKLNQVAAGNGTSFDTGVVSTAFGWAMYLHLFGITGTSVTVKVQDSANDSVWADITGATFAAAAAAGTSQRVSDGPTSTATVRRYLRIVSTGTFTSATFGVNFVRYEAGGHQ
jgi:hypothetical protein